MDIALSWDPAALAADWSVAGGDLAGGHDLETAVLISLLSDRRAHRDDVIPDGTDDRRGWSGDGDIPLGSRLWLYRRAKRDADTLHQIRAAAQECLQWLVDDEVAREVKVKAEWRLNEPAPLILKIVIPRRKGGEVALQYAFAWGEV